MGILDFVYKQAPSVPMSFNITRCHVQRYIITCLVQFGLSIKFVKQSDVSLCLRVIQGILSIWTIVRVSSEFHERSLVQINSDIYLEKAM